jgi:hypothetical protein
MQAPIRIYLTNGQFKTLIVTKDTTAKELNQKFGQKLAKVFNQNFSGYFLYQITDGTGNTDKSI